MAPLLSIIVPTRDRPETALPCLRELSAMVGDDFEIVVSDCGVAVSLQDAVRALADPRIRYAKVAPCSMTDNFNRAYAVSRGRYVTYIGDDDIFPPTSLIAMRAIAETGVEAISYLPRACYFWDDFPVAAQAGKLFLYGLHPPRDLLAASHRASARMAMDRTLRSVQGPPPPAIYHGIVARSALERVVARHGKLFDTPSPDTFVTAALCSVLDEYMIVDVPLTVYGKSGVSNSARVLDKTDDTHLLQFQAVERAWDRLIPPVETVEAHFSHSYLVAFRAMGDVEFEATLVRHHLGDVYALSLLRNVRQAGAILAHLGKAIMSDRRMAHRSFARAFVKRLIERVGGRLRQRFVPPTTDTVVVAVPSLSAGCRRDRERAFHTQS